MQAISPDHKYLGLHRPTIFAHRGSSYFAPENTLPAFQLAVQQQADAIELDAKLSSDRQVVVIHDQTVNRTTNGVGQVDRMTLSELKNLDAGSYFDVAYAGEKIPSLAEVFEKLANSILINIELKNYATPRDDLPERVIGLVRQYAIRGSVFFSSFNPIALLRAHRLMPDVPLGLLAMKGTKGVLLRSWLGRLIPHQALHPNWSDVNLTLVEKNHRHGYRVHPYTVNDPAAMLTLFKAGVDGLYTDNPPLAQKVLAEM
jgi:glycerophosphoryl diester phosphodiesterase